MSEGPRIPAPDRDLANVPPFLPPDSLQVGPTARSAFGTIAIAIGTVVLLNKLIGAIVDTRPGPMQISQPNIITSDWLAVAAGICFFASGALLFGKGVKLPSILLAIGLVLGIISRWIL